MSDSSKATEDKYTAWMRHVVFDLAPAMANDISEIWDAPYHAGDLEERKAAAVAMIKRIHQFCYACSESVPQEVIDG